LNPHRALDALVCGYASPVRAKKVLVIMQYESPSTHAVYVDESAGSGQGKILLLSACIQTYPVWAQFSDDWHQVLQTPPAINAFHVRQARKREGDFVAWKSLDLDLKIIALTEVIVRHDPRVFTCWISEEDYAETIRAHGPPDVQHAYFTCFLAIIMKVAEYQVWRGITTPADFIFDEKGDIGYEALLWYSEIRDTFPKEIKRVLGSTPVFRDDEEVLPLQAADLIAWRKRRRKEIGGLDPELASSMRIDELEGGEVHISRGSLEATAAKFRTLPGIREAQGQPSCYKQLKQGFRKKHGKRQ
jgi:hypothetical protein